MLAVGSFFTWKKPHRNSRVETWVCSLTPVHIYKVSHCMVWITSLFLVLFYFPGVKTETCSPIHSSKILLKTCHLPAWARHHSPEMVPIFMALTVQRGLNDLPVARGNWIKAQPRTQDPGLWFPLQCSALMPGTHICVKYSPWDRTYFAVKATYTQSNEVWVFLTAIEATWGPSSFVKIFTHPPKSNLISPPGSLLWMSNHHWASSSWLPSDPLLPSTWCFSNYHSWKTCILYFQFVTEI